MEKTPEYVAEHSRDPRNPADPKEKKTERAKHEAAERLDPEHAQHE